MSESGGSKSLSRPLKSHAETEPRFGASEQLWDMGGARSVTKEIVANGYSSRISPARALADVSILKSCHKLSWVSLGTAVREKNGQETFRLERLEAERGDDRQS
ncbi:MAG: hypothetical protein FRX48_01722 [Lasallia pustulata]|uniref:Uncharacterized protein n=1 Tax=Lasallia pustulata TaxID=136370 RepID=A0A5M8PYY4_9LECA|nr:MAG: hypothetical protein FRX48_01722 [Lasallia pustulata]